jgi:hypothetical protein
MRFSSSREKPKQVLKALRRVPSVHSSSEYQRSIICKGKVEYWVSGRMLESYRLSEIATREVFRGFLGIVAKKDVQNEG